MSWADPDLLQIYSKNFKVKSYFHIKLCFTILKKYLLKYCYHDLKQPKQETSDKLNDTTKFQPTAEAAGIPVLPAGGHGYRARRWPMRSRQSTATFLAAALDCAHSCCHKITLSGSIQACSFHFS